MSINHLKFKLFLCITIVIIASAVLYITMSLDFVGMLYPDNFNPVEDSLGKAGEGGWCLSVSSRTCKNHGVCSK